MADARIRKLYTANVLATLQHYLDNFDETLRQASEKFPAEYQLGAQNIMLNVYVHQSGTVDYSAQRLTDFIDWIVLNPDVGNVCERLGATHGIRYTFGYMHMHKIRGRYQLDTGQFYFIHNYVEEMQIAPDPTRGLQYVQGFLGLIPPATKN
jgi:hypothetical protein